MTTPLDLPPNIMADFFGRSVKEVSKTVGPENVNVITQAEHLKDETYLEQPFTHGSRYILNQDYLVASAVVFLRSVPEIQA
ncbi:hypothetical protein N7468_009198 [Penicillium chermesinum]|uniref:Uncharacterized protein n=1 Tax=Penicillium chermesinum TaxID=63820 RepID=A0A9W9TF16_9EURO|nr:uncharacterized protein N7468_009198 [Penicillium chermesinum]KAJ5219994.1 hypothetical protein N7468_009198 [Penicillium chermesinum]KAJ6157451.1 hypothetical protein N7470_005043 [Penicillium chermesinum]